MAEKIAQAISFANNYFSLVDGLASEIDEYLAEDVILDWFGQTISGRENVAAFMKYHKMTTRHIFSDISPTDSIGYRKTPPIRRKFFSLGGANGNDHGIIQDDSGIQYKRKCFSDQYQHLNKSENERLDDSIDVVETEMDFESTEMNKTTGSINDSVINTEMEFGRLTLENLSTPCQTFKLGVDPDDSGYVLHDIPLSSQIIAQIKPTNTDEIERSIAQLKLKGQQETFGKSEIGEYYPRVPLEPLKFVEACGAVEFSRFFHTKQVRKDTRRRHCKVQIAYSIRDKNINPPIKSDLGVEIESKNYLKRSLNCSGSYTDTDDSFEERNEFLNCLKEELTNKYTDIDQFMTPKYVRGRLKFDKNEDVEKFNVPGSGFIFNYNIHVIIYGSNTRCRLNLSNEFEGKEFLEESE